MRVYAKEEIRKKILQYHNIDGSGRLSGIDGVRGIMARLRSIQYDPLNVVGRNADLVLQARVEDYKPEQLYSLLYEEHSLLDGYDKEMCIYNTEDFFRFARVREAHTQAVLNTLRYRGQTEALDILEDVKAFVEEHGPVGTKDLSIGEVRESRWGHKKLSSAALDYLYNRGDLCVADKKGTQKYFDLTERIIPSDLRGTEELSRDEFLEWYIARRIRSVGIVWDKNGGAWQGDLLGDRELRKTVLERLAEKNSISVFGIEGLPDVFYACGDFDDYCTEQGQKDYARFLAPLDNVMWDRTMLEKIFDFSYRWEVYTPVPKRKYGYYVLPVVYNNCFVARFEPEAVGRTGCFRIKNWWWEEGIRPDERMKAAILKETDRFCKYLGAECAEENRKKLDEQEGKRGNGSGRI